MGIENVALARQPILDRQQQLVGYELLFRRAGEDRAVITDNFSATTQVVNNAFTDIGIKEVLGCYKGFVNVDEQFLASEFVRLLPPDRVVLELLEGITFTPEVVRRCLELKARGYRFALDDFDGDHPELASALMLADIVKVDLTLVNPLDLGPLAAGLRRKERLLLAEKVETVEQFQTCQKHGFDLFQGYYFARPQTLVRRRAASSRATLVRLLSLVMSDAGINDLEAEFKRHPQLCVVLLRLVNSAATGIHHVVSSLRHAIVILGRRRLQGWLQLLVFTTGDARTGTPLLQMAACRGRLLERLAMTQRRADREFHDWAFMAGILSLMDVLLELPLADLLAQINPARPVVDALLERKGELGNLLSLVERLEIGDRIGVEDAVADLHVSLLGSLIPTQLEAYHWANTISSSAQEAA